MPSETWPEVVIASYATVWVYGGWAEVDAEVDAFAEHWGGFEVEAFKRALRDGEGNEKLFAISALGECALPEPELEALLTSLLHSSERMERWVSAITLGRHKQEQAFPLLQEMLLEGIFDYAAFTDSTSQAVDALVNAAIDEGDRLPDSQRYWEKLVEPVILEMWNRRRALSDEYDWYFHHRGTIALLLGWWGDGRAVPVLRHALQEAYRIEQCPGPYDGTWEVLLQQWHSYQDCLAYALGELAAWAVFPTLTAPPPQLSIASMYFMLGLLSTPRPRWDAAASPQAPGAANNLRGISPALFPHALRELIAQGAVQKVLKEYCGLRENECVPFIQRFWQCYDEREKKEKGRVNLFIS